MPRRSKSTPKYRRKTVNGFVYAVVTIGGKDCYLGQFDHEASKAEYDRLIGEWLANGRRLPSAAVNDSITVMELSAEYLKFCRTYYVKNGKPTDEQAGVKAALKYLNNLYCRMPGSDFGPLAFETVRNRMIESGNCRGYINNSMNRIRRMFRWAASKELLNVSIYHSLKTVDGLKKGKTEAKESDPVLPLDGEIIDATIAKASEIVADMIRFQRLTACRPGEVCSIRPVDIDRVETVWRYWPDSHKMEHKQRSRVILVGPKAQAILLPYLLRDENELCFQKPTGGRFQRWNYHEKIKQACNKAFPAPEGTKGKELKAWRKKHAWAPNRLRHTGATEIREKFGVEASQVILGHSKIETTQIYAERDVERAAKIMNEFG